MNRFRPYLALVAVLTLVPMSRLLVRGLVSPGPIPRWLAT